MAAEWQMKRNMLSLTYMTQWRGIPLI
ncbi:DUF4113 domain-containing protein [Salmonella enterica]|nr:DUF4113 domain-containing protein [Salmonella enterica]